MANEKTNKLSWTFPEFNQPSRSSRWWLGFSLIIILAFLYSILTANFLFALILIIISSIIVFRHYHEPDQVECVLSAQGIYLDNKHYTWREFDNFWFAYEPPEVKKLYLKFKSIFRPNLVVLLSKQNPLVIREYLSQYLAEDFDKEGEPTSDALGRLLKL